MLRRTMSAPARMSFSSISSLSEAGPRVKMTLVRRSGREVDTVKE
jgi:hypothetical protein